jgi:tetratricopeptide (TPR) repeat protein
MTAAVNLSTVLNDAIKLNNDGVLLIENGLYPEARMCLQKALKKTRSVGHAMKKNGMKPRQPSTPLRYRWAQAAPLQVTDSDSFVFKRALSIVESEEDPLGLSNCRAESTTMLFNLGLSFHLDAASNPQARVAYSRLLQTALECYRVAVSMRRQHLSERLPDIISGEQLFDLILANNAAEIHRYLMNYDEAAIYYQQVSESLPAFKDLLPTEDFVGLCLNLASFAVPQMAAAA